MRLDETFFHDARSEKTIDETGKCLHPRLLESWHERFVFIHYIAKRYFILLNETGPSNLSCPVVWSRSSRNCNPWRSQIRAHGKLGLKMLLKTCHITESNPTIIFQFYSCVFILLLSSLVMSKISTLHTWFARSLLKVRMSPSCGTKLFCLNPCAIWWERKYQGIRTSPVKLWTSAS